MFTQLLTSFTFVFFEQQTSLQTESWLTFTLTLLFLKSIKESDCWALSPDKHSWPSLCVWKHLCCVNILPQRRLDSSLNFLLLSLNVFYSHSSQENPKVRTSLLPPPALRTPPQWPHSPPPGLTCSLLHPLTPHLRLLSVLPLHRPNQNRTWSHSPKKRRASHKETQSWSTGLQKKTCWRSTASPSAGTASTEQLQQPM